MQRVGGRRVVAAAFAVLLLTSVVAGTGLAAVGSDRPAADRPAAVTTGPTAPDERVTTAVSPTGGTASAVGTDDVFDRATTNVTATQELQLTPAERGRITVVQRYQVPDRVGSLKPTLPAEATVTGTTGFSRADGQTYEWDGNTSAPQITFTMQVNQTRDLAGPEGARGRYLFVDAGEWALVQRPSIPTSWSWSGSEPVGISRTATTNGPGYVGEWMAYLGEVRTHERTAHGQQFTLVVPERASLAESPESVLDSLSAASDQLRVGNRDPRVNVFAAPTTTVQWGVRGLQYGDRDMWVRDVERLATAENTWLHEYVHTRQDYETTPSARWTTEAFATYYAALLAYEQDRVGYDAFRETLRPGTVRPQSEAVLTEPSTWASAANYLKGSLVAANVDRRIRLATDSTRSLQAVFSELNAASELVDARYVFEVTDDVSTAEVRRAAVTYASTERAPELWTEAEHARAFGSTPARIEVGVASGADALTVSGPYRNQSLSGSEVTLFTGETLTVTGAVENTGDAAAEYAARFVVDGRVAATKSGTVAPGERVTHRYNVTFERTGDHTVAVGGDEVAVEVYEPAGTTVTALSANRTSLSEPGAVALTATVSNTHGVPARGAVRLGGPDGPILDRTVTLGPNENRSITAVARFDRGRYEFTVGQADPLVVTVGTTDSGSNGGDGGSESGGQNGDGGDGSTGGSSGFGPGFGPVTAVVVLLGTLGLLARRRG
ncbi:MAG: PGF-CTERM sorting domain-containing protein [Halobacteriales archaeon]